MCQEEKGQPATGRPSQFPQTSAPAWRCCAVLHPTPSLSWLQPPWSVTAQLLGAGLATLVYPSCPLAGYMFGAEMNLESRGGSRPEATETAHFVPRAECGAGSGRPFCLCSGHGCSRAWGRLKVLVAGFQVGCHPRGPSAHLL